jgi:quercetin dioxygenase-like cupin family protein
LPNNLVSLCGRVDGYAYRTGRQQSGSLELQDRKRVMRRRTISRAHLAALVLAALLAGGALAQMSGPAPVALTADEMKWSPQGALALPGLEQVNLVGEPSKPGPYTIRLKFPAGYKLAPHTHPDPREVTILSGTWYTGYGDKYDPALLKALPAGSFYTEPANLSHFVEVREPVVIQVSGTGPSGRSFVNPDVQR